MNKSLLYFLIALLIFWIILGAYLCCRFLGGIGCTGDDNNTTKNIIQKTAQVWSVSDGSKFTAGADQKIDFLNSNYAYLPLGGGVLTLLDNTSKYLTENPNRSVNITGHYGSSETNNSILPTLGLARATQIKKYLSSKGIDGKRINTKDLLVSSSKGVRDTLFGGIDLSFGAIAANSGDRLTKIKDNLIGKPIRLYFETGSNKVNLSAEQRTLFSDIIYYLDNVSSSNLSVNGYTDSVGKKSRNITLSQERADFIKTYLTNNGISDTRMTATGYGPDNPIGDNERSTGRAQNRRVEVLLK